MSHCPVDYAHQLDYDARHGGSLYDSAEPTLGECLFCWDIVPFATLSDHNSKPACDRCRERFAEEVLDEVSSLQG